MNLSSGREREALKVLAALMVFMMILSMASASKKKKGKKGGGGGGSTPPCSGSIGHDTHYHGGGTSGGTGYQDWHVNFQYNRGGCGGTAPNYIHISDDDGNSVQVNNPGNNYRVTTSDYGWLQGGDQVTVYFQKFGTSSSVTKTMPDPNRAPDIPSSLSPTGDEKGKTPNVEASYSDPDGDSGTLYFEDGSGSNIGSCNVADGGSCSVHYSSADSWGTSYTYRVYAEDNNGQTSSRRTRSFTTNYAPNTGNLNPAGSDRGLEPQLTATYSDQDGGVGTLYFEKNSGANIGSCDAGNGDSCSVDFDSADSWGTSYTYRVYAEDSMGATSNWVQQSFTTNYRPSVSNVRPSDGPVQVNPELEAEITDQDAGDTVTVRFINSDNGNLIGTDTVSGGSTEEARVDTSGTGFASQSGQQYSFRVEADDGQTSSSASSSFRTNNRPSVESFSIENSSQGHRLDVNVVAADGDGAEDIERCDLRVSDGSDHRDYEINDPVVTGSNEVTCDFGTIDHNTVTSWNHTADLEFDLTVSDQYFDTRASKEKALPNHAPEIDSINFETFRNRGTLTISSIIEFLDDGSSEVRSCSILIDDGESSFSAGTMQRIDTSEIRCQVEEVGPQKFPSLTVNEQITVTVKATDLHGKVSSRSIMYNVPPGFEYPYSAIIVSSGGVDFLDYRVRNRGGAEADYRSELKNVNASFTENGQDSITYSLSQGGTRSLSVRVTPKLNVTGTKELKIVTENLDTGLEQTDTIKLQVRQTGGGGERAVPGIGLLQLFMILILSAMILYRRSPAV